MKQSFIYGHDVIEYDFPEEHVGWTIEAAPMEPCSDPEAELVRALDNPIGTPSFRELVARKPEKVVLIVDDLTRQTPQKLILSVLLRQLEEGGVPDSNITILIALGTHRAMTVEECVRCYGQEVVDRYKIVNHDSVDYTTMKNLGVTPNGIPVEVNTIYAESDLSVGIGNIIPHIYAGFSGGAKTIVPGVCSSTTTAYTHLVATKHLFEVIGNPENPIREDMEVIAKQTGLTMIVNSVLNPDHRLVKIVAGDQVLAHREGVKWARKIYCVEHPGKVDMILVNSYPGDLDLWQCAKAMTVGCCFAQPGTPVILMTPAYEGIPTTHPELLELGDKSSAEVYAMLEAKQIKDEVAGTVHLTYSQCWERNKLIFVRELSNKAAIEKKGITYCPDLASAIAEAEKFMPKDYKMGIISHGSHTSP
jgi:nickel-dependent lactate racemase